MTSFLVWLLLPLKSKDKDLANAVDIIGTHCPGVINGNKPPPRDVLGKPMWDTGEAIREANCCYYCSDYC